MWLKVLDTCFTFLHVFIIGFNLTGWIFPKVRRLHFWFTMCTLWCWVVLGCWYGWGYCPITDWQWEVKAKLGETKLPNSFVKYLADRLFTADLNSGFIDILTVSLFFLSIVISVWLNFLRKNQFSRHLH